MEQTIERSQRPKKVTIIMEDVPRRSEAVRHGAEHEGNGGIGRLLTLATFAFAGYTLYKRYAREPERPGKGAIHVSKSVTIDRPVSEIYRFWRNLENLPRAMSHVESVRQRPDGRSHWTAKGPAGTKIEWDAETLIDRENEIISWRSVKGADVPNEGTVRFRDLGDGQKTEVKVSLTYHPPGGAIGAGVAKLFGEEPSQQVEADLRRLKKELEGSGAGHGPS